MFNKDSILKILEKKGWSKYKLCKEAHLAQSTLSDILSGKAKNPNTKTLQKIADALGVSINEFFDEDDNSKNTEEINIPQEYLKQHKVTSRDKKQFLEYMKKINEVFLWMMNLMKKIKKKYWTPWMKYFGKQKLWIKEKLNKINKEGVVYD